MFSPSALMEAMISRSIALAVGPQMGQKAKRNSTLNQLSGAQRLSMKFSQYCGTRPLSTTRARAGRGPLGKGRRGPPAG